jgi:hypothetical protein
MHQRRKRRTSSFAKSSLEHMHCSTCNLEFSIDLGVQNYHQGNLRLLFKLFVPVVGRLTIFGFCYSKKIKCSDFIRCPSGQPLLVRFPYLESHLPPESWPLPVPYPGESVSSPGTRILSQAKKIHE